MKRMLLSCLALAALSAGAIARADDDSILKNGDFQSVTGERADGWPAPKGDMITYPQEGDNRFMRLKMVEPGKMVMAYRQFDLKPDDKTFTLTFKVRYENIKVGEKPYFDGRIVVNFRDGSQKEVKGGPAPAYWRGSRKDWADGSMTITVPEGAKVMAVMFTLFNAAEGTLDFDDVKLVRGAVDASKKTSQPGAATQAKQAPKLQPTPEQQKLIDEAKRVKPDQPAPKLDLNPGVEGAPNPNFGQMEERFKLMHESNLKRKEKPIGLLFIGDSITQSWSTNTLRKLYGQYNVANFGVGGDGTQHMLWRIEHGELDGITPNPRVVVILAGTNNSYPNSVEEVVAGVKAVTQKVHEKLPESKVLLLGIFPRGANATEVNGKPAMIRAKLQAINANLAKMDDGEKTRYLEIWNEFLAPDGSLSRDIMPDSLHPNTRGYEIWAEAMRPMLENMLK